MHRKNTLGVTRTDMFRHLLAGLMLLAATAGILAIFLVTAQTANAVNPAMFTPAANAAAQLRPAWDGVTPKRWTGQDAMCPASSARMHRWARADADGPWFRVECLPDGPDFWAWGAIVKR